MYSKSIFIFLIIGILSLAKINGVFAEGYTGQCNDIKVYLESQGKGENLNGCDVNDKGEVTGLTLYLYCLGNEQLKTILSYKTIETLIFTLSWYHDDDERIISIHGCLSIPSDYEVISTLTNLKNLILEGELNMDINLIRNIPKSVENLSIKRYLFDKYIKFTQNMADGLSKLTNLNSLSIEDTDIDIKLDFSKFENLKKLTSLEIKNVNFAYYNYIPTNLLKYCKYLKKLIIDDGTVDENGLNIISDLTQLEELELYYIDYMNGANFSSINKLKNLTSLKLHCSLYDELNISSNFFRLTKLKNLEIDECAIIPSSKSLTWSNFKNLEHLYMATVDEEYYREVFDFKYLGDMPSLKEVHIFAMGYPSIPESIGNLKNLEILELKFNEITEIPKSIGKLQKLRVLDLSGNNIKALPDEIGNLKNLEEINIFVGDLTRLPETVGNLANLKKIYITKTKLMNIPKNIGNLSKLQSFDLTENKITEIPKSIGNLNIENLYLQSNNIQRIPDEVGNMKNLKLISLEDNIINDISNIPSSLKNLKNPFVIDLSGNEIERIPENIGDMKNVTKIYISGNKITNIPSSLGNLDKLEVLSLNSNLIDDDLPESLNNLPNLRNINLDYNINIKGKTLTNPSLTECSYHPKINYTYSLCASVNATCIDKWTTVPLCEED